MKPKRPKLEAWAVVDVHGAIADDDSASVYLSKGEAARHIFRWGHQIEGPHIARLVPHDPTEQRALKALKAAYVEIGRIDTKKGRALMAAVDALLKRRAKK